MSKSYTELIEERDALDREIEKALGAEKQATIKMVREAIELFNLTPADCGFKSAKKQPSNKPDGRSAPKKPKYQNPKKPDETWNGLGATSKRPIWVREHLAAGGTLDELLIAPK